MIQPIETRYQGYLFRSRLEARWAVFFDHLRLHWEYEKEGFYIDDVMYLPDFYVRSESDQGWFIEVKGDVTDTESVRKAKLLDQQPPPYASGCILVSTLEFPAPQDMPAEHNHMNTVARLLLADESLVRVMQAVEQARMARFQNGWR